MSDLWRVRVTWDGTKVVGGGVNTFYVLPDTPGIPAAFTGFYDAIKGFVPTGALITILGSGEVIDGATGKPKGVWSQGGNGTKAGTGGTAYAAGVGGRVVWATAGWNNGRRVRGSTYIVPMATPMYDTDGTIVASAAGTVTGAGVTLLSALNNGLVVWSRGASGNFGTTAVVTGATMPDKVSWLRSRRV